MRNIASIVKEGHPDYDALIKIRNGISRRAGSLENLVSQLPIIIKDAIDFVIDPVRTGRTIVAELDGVEKTFIGLKIEHYLRDFLDVPAGIRDLVIDDVDVDVKNTIRTTWMIPPETYRTEDPCLLIASAEHERFCWLGLMLARSAYLNKPNRDRKRSVSAFGLQNILWLVKAAPFPTSRWDGIDMLRFRELRKMKGGSKRAATFFREYLGKPIHRSVVHALLHDQLDYMKRLRENQGARDILSKEGIALLSGSYDAAEARALGFENLQADEWLAVLTDE